MKTTRAFYKMAMACLSVLFATAMQSMAGDISIKIPADVNLVYGSPKGTKISIPVEITNTEYITWNKVTLDMSKSPTDGTSKYTMLTFDGVTVGEAIPTASQGKVTNTSSSTMFANKGTATATFNVTLPTDPQPMGYNTTSKQLYVFNFSVNDTTLVTEGLSFDVTLLAEGQTAKTPVWKTADSATTPTTRAQDFQVSNIATTSAKLKVVKIYNAADFEDTVSWDAATVATTYGIDNIEFTDEKGQAITANNKFTAIDTAKIAVTNLTTSAADTYSEANFGKFTVTDTAITWDLTPAQRAYIKHNNFKLEVPFTAENTELGASDSAKLIITLNPVNQKPVVAFGDLETVLAGKMVEDNAAAIEIPFNFTDPEGDALNIAASNALILIDGMETAIVCTVQNGKLVVPANAIPYDAVIHPDKNNGWSLVFIAADDYATDSKTTVAEASFVATSNAAIIDTDRVRNAADFAAATSNLSLLPTSVRKGETVTAEFTTDLTDEDGDEFVFTYSFNGGAATETKTYTVGNKGDAYYVTAISNTYPYGIAGGIVTQTTGYATTARYVQNTAPTSTNLKDIFVQKTGATETQTNITALDNYDLAQNVSDVDGAADIDWSSAAYACENTNLSVVISNGHATIKIVDGSVEVKDAIVTFSVSDKAIAEKSISAESTSFTVKVNYQANPLPVIDTTVPTVHPEATESEYVEGTTTKQSAALQVNFKDQELLASGIASIAAKVRVSYTDTDGKPYSEFVDASSCIKNAAYTPTTGTDSCQWTATFEFNPDLINGAKRAASGKVEILFDVTDVQGGVATDLAPEGFTFTLNDTDRKPTWNGGAVVTEKDISKYYTTYALKVKASTAAAVDPDGDAVTYVFDSSVAANTHNVEDFPEGSASIEGTFDTLVTIDPRGGKYLVWDDEVLVKATAKAAPAYASTTSLEAENTFSTTVKYGYYGPGVSAYNKDLINTIYEQVAGRDGVPETTLKIAYDKDREFHGTDEIFVVECIEAELKLDKLTYDLIDKNGDMGEGAITVTPIVKAEDPKGSECGIYGATVTIKPTKDGWNGVMTDIWYSVRFLDGRELSRPASSKTTWSVTAINQAPVFELPTYDVTQLDNRTYSFTVPISMGPKGCDDEEESQGIKTANVACTSSLIDGDITVKIGNGEGEEFVEEAEGKVVQLTFTLKDSVEFGDEDINYTLEITDNGPTAGTYDRNTSDKVSGVISIVSTPWYPIFRGQEDAISEAEYDGIEVVITDAEGEDCGSILKMGKTDEEGKFTVMPIDYQKAAVSGLLPGTYTYTSYYWTYAEGRGAIAQAAQTVEVTDYSLPKKEQMKYENKALSINAPMASEFNLLIFNSENKVVFNFCPYTFQADEKTGIILPRTSFDLALANGTYRASIRAWNPKGASASAQELVFEVTEGEEPSLDDWDITLPNAAPASGEKLVTADEGMFLTFQWDAAPAATSYTWTLYNVQGETVTIAMSDSPTTIAYLKPGQYYWAVEATDGENKVTSLAQALTIVTEGEEGMPISDGVSVTDGCLTLNLLNAKDGEVYSYDIIYMDSDTSFQRVVVTGTVQDGKLVTELPFKEGYYAMIRLWDKKNAVEKEEYKTFKAPADI